MKMSVMFFVSRNGEHWMDLVQTHLGDEVAAHYAESAEVFTEMSTHSPGQWRILVVDPRTLGASRDAIDRFISENPTMAVAVVEADAGFQARPPVHGLRVFRGVSDLDSWLEMMRSLLDRTG